VGVASDRRFRKLEGRSRATRLNRALEDEASAAEISNFQKRVGSTQKLLFVRRTERASDIGRLPAGSRLGPLEGRDL